jgi:hypothetical protein
MVTAGAIPFQLYLSYVQDPDGGRPRQITDVMPESSLSITAVGQVTRPIHALENQSMQKELPVWRQFQVQIQQFMQKKVTVLPRQPIPSDCYQTFVLNLLVDTEQKNLREICKSMSQGTVLDIVFDYFFPDAFLTESDAGQQIPLAAQYKGMFLS